MPKIYSRTYTDYSNEKSTFSTALDPAELQAAIDTLTAATDAMTGAVPAKLSVSEETRLSNQTPASQAVHRENKLLIRYEDSVSFKVYTLTIPAIDLSQVTLLPDSDMADIAQAPLSTWIAAFEAVAFTPEGNSPNVLSAQYVGRNS